MLEFLIETLGEFVLQAVGDALLRIDRFSYGYLFALSLALVRFQFAH